MVESNCLTLTRVSSTPRLDRRHCTRRQTKLGRERGASDLDHTHGIDRQLDRVLACHRIRAVGVVEHQRALTTATAADTEQPVRPSNDAGDEWERVLKPLTRDRRRLHHARRDPLDTSADSTVFDRVRTADDAYFHVKSIDVEAQGHVCGLA
jgi:hypothetical protein